MPKVKITSVEKYLEFVNIHRKEIENKEYELRLSDWSTDLLDDSERDFLYNLNDWSIHEVLASGIKNSSDLYKKLSKHYMESIRAAVAINKATPKSVIETLKLDSSYDFWKILIKAYKSDSKSKSLILERFSDSENDSFVSFLLREEFEIPIEILEKYAKSKNDRFRTFVASHPMINDYIQETLYFDNDYLVKYALIENNQTSLETLKKMFKDSSEYIGRYQSKLFLPISKMAKIKYKKLTKKWWEFWK